MNDIQALLREIEKEIEGKIEKERKKNWEEIVVAESRIDGMREAITIICSAMLAEEKRIEAEAVRRLQDRATYQ